MATVRTRSGKLIEVDDKLWAEDARYTWSGYENADRDRCHEQGGIFIRSYFKVDRTFVRGYCKNEKYERR